MLGGTKTKVPSMKFAGTDLPGDPYHNETTYLTLETDHISSIDFLKNFWVLVSVLKFPTC